MCFKLGQRRSIRASGSGSAPPPTAVILNDDRLEQMTRTGNSDMRLGQSTQKNRPAWPPRVCSRAPATVAVTSLSAPPRPPSLVAPCAVTFPGAAAAAKPDTCCVCHSGRHDGGGDGGGGGDGDRSDHGDGARWWRGGPLGKEKIGCGSGEGGGGGGGGGSC